LGFGIWDLGRPQFPNKTKEAKSQTPPIFQSGEEPRSEGVKACCPHVERPRDEGDEVLIGKAASLVDPSSPISNLVLPKS
jgi:hypothetical protein